MPEKDKMQKRIMYIIPTLGIGGTQRQLVNLIQGLIKEVDYYIEVSTLYKGGPIAEELNDLGIKINYINMKNIYDLFSLRRLIRILRYGNFNIVHTFLFDANVLGAFSAKQAGVEAIISSRRDMDIWKFKRHIWAERLGAKLSKKIIANSNAVKEFVIQQEKISPSKIEVILNGIDLNSFHKSKEVFDLRKEFGLSKDHFIIGTIGTISEKKGQRYLIKAAREILNVFSQSRFIFVGNGPLENELRKLTNTLSLSDKVVFTGLRQDVTAILSMIDIFCLPSIYESCPNVILEAMACGLPVVATNVGGVSEIVINEEIGTLVPSKDPEAIAKAIIKLLRHEGLREKMVQQGRKIVEQKFSLERMVSDYHNFYERLLYSKEIN